MWQRTFTVWFTTNQRYSLSLPPLSIFLNPRRNSRQVILTQIIRSPLESTLFSFFLYVYSIDAPCSVHPPIRWSIIVYPYFNPQMIWGLIHLLVGMFALTANALVLLVYYKTGLKVGLPSNLHFGGLLSLNNHQLVFFNSSYKKLEVIEMHVSGGLFAAKLFILYYRMLNPFRRQTTQPWNLNYRQRWNVFLLLAFLFYVV